MSIINTTVARVLVVEDEPNIGAIIVFKLEREGHAVTWVTEAARVMAAAEMFGPDLVLLDSTLPDGDAFLLLEELTGGRPVVVLTEFRDAAAPARARAAGAAATVEKPFKPTQLARLVDSWPRRPTSCEFVTAAARPRHVRMAKDLRRARYPGMAVVTEVERLLDGGRAAEAAGNVREALVRFESAVKLAPDEATPVLHLGTLCHRLRDYERARRLLERAAGLDPDNPEITFRLGAACEALGDREAAAVAYGRTMVLAPAGWQTWFLIGRQHRQLGRAEVARAAYRKALEVAPDQPDVLAEVGSLLWETGLPEEAFPYLEAAARAHPTDPGLALQLGLAYLHRNNVVAAQTALLNAKHLDPSDRLIDRALQDLAARKKRNGRRKRAA